MEKDVTEQKQEPALMTSRNSYALTNNGPSPVIALHDDEGAFVTIKNSGEVILREGLEISDAARRFWEKLAEVFPAFKAAILAAATEQKQEPIAVKVKPLEWVDGYAFCAPINSGFYHVSHMLGPKKWHASGASMPNGFIQICDNEVEAKAAAQADYERRIFSAIEPAPDLAAENARLREAAIAWAKLDAQWQYELSTLSAPTKHLDLRRAEAEDALEEAAIAVYRATLNGGSRG